MAAPIRIVRRQRRPGIGIYDDLGESRVVILVRFRPEMAYVVIRVPVMARFGDVGAENDRGCDRRETEKANSQITRGNQVGPKHELSRPIFCLDHCFVRPNYAQRRSDVSLFESRQRGFFRSIGRQSAILAKTLFTNRFPRLSQTEQTRGIRLGGWGFEMIKEALRKSTGFEVFDDMSKGRLCNAPSALGEREPSGSQEQGLAGRPCSRRRIKQRAFGGIRFERNGWRGETDLAAEIRGRQYR